ncbi:hypothetical protein JCM11491_000916 [Sporobolomyces phaffii]
MIRSTPRRLLAAPCPATRGAPVRRLPFRPSHLSPPFRQPVRRFGSTRLVAGQVKEFKLADIGEGITECEIVKWLVKPGDTISEFDPVAEVQSDKASVEITSPFSGTIRSIAGDVGDMLKVGATLCQVELDGGGDFSSAAGSTITPATTSSSASVPTVRTGGATTMKQFKLADIGEGITECEVVKWLVKPGDEIEEFDPIVEVTSDKASVEITSPYSGTIKTLAGGVGEMLKVGATLCEIEVVASAEAGDATAIDDSTLQGSSGSTSEVPHPVRPDPTLGSASVLATPATRRFARELKVDLTQVTPTGRDGRVTKGDVLEYSKQSQGDSRPFVPFERPPVSTPTSTSPPSSAPRPTSNASLAGTEATSTTIPLSSTRRAMYRAMSASLEMPHFAYSDTVDVTLLERLRLSLNSNVPLEYRKTLSPKDALSIERARQWNPLPYTGHTVEESAKFDRITLLPLLLKALSTALHEHPLFACILAPSSSSSSSNGGAEPSLVRRPAHDISVAVSSPAPSGGLFTPVLRSVDTQSVFAVASNLTRLQSFVSPASGGAPPKFPPEFQGAGTVTLSNIGAIGGRTTHPVIPPTGQLAIGAMGRVRVEPRFSQRDGEEDRAKRVARGDEVDLTGEWKIEPRLVMDVSFSADHRVVEGVELARLVETWKGIIEDPTRLMA